MVVIMTSLDNTEAWQVPTCLSEIVSEIKKARAFLVFKCKRIKKKKIIKLCNQRKDNLL